MRCILRMFVVLAIASPAWAAQDIAPSAVPSQEPTVSTPVPNIHSPGAPVVTTPSSSSVYQTPASAPTATAPASAPTTATPTSAPTTRYYGYYVVQGQPGTTSAAPMSNTTGPYYYYPMRTRFGLFRRMTPAYTYSSVNASPTYVSASQTYYTPVQRRGLFGLGLFQRRYRPVYQTVYTPTTYTAPAGTVTTGTTPAATAPVYTPTTYTVPTGTPPAGTSSAGTAAAATAPAATTPAPTTPAPRIPPPPPLPVKP